MKENSVAALAGLLGITADVINESVEKDEIGGLIENWKKDKKIYTEAELGKLIENKSVEYLDNLTTSGEKIPQKLYNHVKGNAFEVFEKKLAKQYGITEYEGSDDLVAKIAEKNNGKDDSEKDKEIDRLKKLVLDTENEKKQIKVEERGKYDKLIVDQHLTEDVNKIDIDAEDEALLNQRKILRTMFEKEYEVKREDGQPVAYKDGQRVNNKVSDPMPISEILLDFAPKMVKIKDVPNGGRGDGTPETQNNAKSFKSMEEFNAYCEKHEIKPYSEDMIKLQKEALEANPELAINF
jgi:hypothetical protein